MDDAAEVELLVVWQQLLPLQLALKTSRVFVQTRQQREVVGRACG